MKTFVSVKTGQRYPERGVSFSKATWSNGKTEIHIKPGYPDCTMGWKKFKPADWREEEIPDLVKPFTREQWVTYADQWGDMVAQEFFECCDYSKPRTAFEMRNPPKNLKLWEDNAAWFKATFRQVVWRFAEGMLLNHCNVYTFDVVRFEDYLKREFLYSDREGESMKDFMTATFGTETTDRFQTVFLKTT